jgi:hypothetical protein
MNKIKYAFLSALIILLPSCVTEKMCEKEANGEIELTPKQEKACEAREEDKPEPTKPEPTKPGPIEPPIVIEPGEPGDSDLIGLSQYIANTVDAIHNRAELAKGRSLYKSFPVDSCHQDLKGMDQFSDAIAFFIGELSKKKVIQMQGIGQYYDHSADPSTYHKISLLSRPLCNVTASSLRHTIKGRRMPDSATIALSQRFADDHNKYRKEFINGDKRGAEKAQRLWGKFFGCLAYTESLTTADIHESRRVAQNVAPTNYRKPAGIKFYIDPKQSQASKLNIGLFQFTPVAGGNINPCIKQWNKDYPSCKINNRSTASMINTVGSARQHFNAYCGVHKLVQTFFVQTHTTKNSRVHPSNFPGGRLKKKSQRCVTPHHRYAYSHFGPLQNTTQEEDGSNSNLKKLMRCVYK